MQTEPTTIEQILYFICMIVGLSLFLAICAWVGEWIMRDKKTDNSQFNQDEFNALNDEHFRDMY